MSIALMNKAFNSALPPTLKLVLIALCDNANEEGSCFPAVSTLMRKTSLSERAVRNCIATLKKQGFLSVVERSGRSNFYFISFKEETPCRICTPAPDAGHPCTSCTPPLQDMHPTPAPHAPITIIEPPDNHHVTKLEEKSNDFPADQLNQDQQQKPKRKPAQKKAAVIVQTPEWMPAPEWLDFIAMRQAIKKPMTEQAQHRMINKLQNFLSRGIDIAAALDASIRNNWSDVYEPRQEKKTKYEETKEWLAQITGKTSKKGEDYVIDI